MAYCTKSADWAYEMEWRAILETPRTAYEYSPDTLTAIYFGARCSNDTVENVREVFGDRRNALKFWQGSRGDFQFKVKFVLL